MLGGVLWGFSSYRNYQLIKRGEYLTSLVEQRTENIMQKNEELLEQAEELRKANDLRSQFLDMAVHDLRNPLGVISGLADLIRSEDPEPEERRNYLQQIERVSGKMLQRVNRLLADSKLDNQLVADKLEMVDMNDLVREVVTRSRVLADRKQQKLEVDFGAQCRVVAEPDLLQDVLDNLISNAIKYGPIDSTVSVTVQRVTHKKQKRDWVEVSVQDEGPGIAEQDQLNVFEAYYTAGSKPSGNESSTGLGLYIAQQVARKLGGEISIQSQPRRQAGSTFLLRLPAI
jgi:signal transduction histidine kinase